MTEFLPKPLYGDPCNNCGLCCIAQQCPISTALFGEQNLCPAIEQGEGKAFICGVIANPADYLDEVPGWGQPALASAFSLMLGAGSGCDGQTAADTPERIDEYRPIIRGRAAEAIAGADDDVKMLVSVLTAREA